MCQKSQCSKNENDVKHNASFLSETYSGVRGSVFNLL